MIIHFFLFLAVALGCCAPLCHGASYAPSAVLGVAAALSVAALSVGVDAAGAAAAVKPSKLRRLADDAMVGGKLDEAVRLLTQACKAERNHQNHYKRFRILLRKKKHAPALADLDAALEIKVDFVSARTQRAKLLQKLGRCDAAYADATYAERSLAQEVFAAGGAATKKGGRVQKKLLKAQKDAQSTQRCALSMQAGHTARAQGNWDQCIHQLGRALEMASLAPALSVARAECQLAKGNLHEAAADAAKALKVDKGHLPALLLRARAFYRLDEKDVALRHIRQLLRSDPAHKEGKTLFRTMKKAKKHVQRAEAAIARGELTEAAAELLASANVDPTHTIVRKALLTRRCELYVQAKLNDEALLACDEAVAVDATMPRPHVMACEALKNLERFDEAVHRCTKAQQLAPQDGNVAEALKKAKAALKQSKEKNYYKILGVPRDATVRQMKKAYHKLALEAHPDKIAGFDKMSDEEKKPFTARFQDIGEAYEVLKDAELRAKYDRGEDVFENQGNGGGGGNPFQHFFHNQGGGGGGQHTFHFG